MSHTDLSCDHPANTCTGWQNTRDALDLAQDRVWMLTEALKAARMVSSNEEVNKMIDKVLSHE